jgi:hypothetical protein
MRGSQLTTDICYYPANVCPFQGDVAAIWSVHVNPILHKRARDFKRFVGVLKAYLQSLGTLAFVGCSQVRQLERKEEMRACRTITGD